MLLDGCVSIGPASLRIHLSICDREFSNDSLQRPEAPGKSFPDEDAYRRTSINPTVGLILSTIVGFEIFVLRVEAGAAR